ncbi:MAG: alpha/beta hydrolase [Ignavibacteriaceae bacterium]|nr:alpha/beta hydrolase [Ignavibacteriaceae bacterium]
MKNLQLLFFFLILSSSTLLFPQQNGFIKTDDGVIQYITYGSGYPILIINGGPGMNCEGFASLAELLKGNNQIILYDQRGTGESKLIKVDSTTVTMDLMAKDIETLRTHLKIKDWIVLGHSFGGILATYYASKYPESINGMILSSSGGIDMDLFTKVGNTIKSRLNKSEKDSLDYWNKKIDSGDTTYYAKYQMAKALAPAYLYDKKYVPLIAERLTQGNSEINGLVFKDLFRIKYDCKGPLRNFKKPVLIIQGRQDIITKNIADKEHSVLKNSRIVIINKCSHYGWLEQKDNYISALENFIRSTPKG